MKRWLREPGRTSRDPDPPLRTLSARVLARCPCMQNPLSSAHEQSPTQIPGGPVPGPAAEEHEWSDIEALLVALGATIVEGRGSRVRFVLNQAVATFHRPHPSKDAKPYQIQDARSFLEQAGIKP